MDTRKGVAGFEQHGVVVLRTINSGKEVVACCPWCKKKEKFFINADNHLWDCKVCGVSGNFEGFLAQVVKHNAQNVADSVLATLGRDRGGVKNATLRAFGVGARGGEYTFPAKMLNTHGEWKVQDVRRYRLGGRPHSTTGAHLGLILPEKLGGTDTVWICEGEWDAFATWQALRAAGVTDDIVGVCGASNFPRKAAPWLTGKKAMLLFDNDTPGQAGMEKTWGILSTVGVKELRRIEWPSDLPQGYDMRDLCMALKWNGKAIKDRLGSMLVTDTPAGAKAAASPASKEVSPDGKGLSAKEVLKRYRKWLDLPSSEVLDVIYGAIFANRMDGDPVWLFLVAPPGGCKSELLMTLDGAPLIHCTTSLTPHAMISGMNFGGQDPSLIPKILGKTLIVKDFTTILSLNQNARDEIFGVLRDAYDGRTSKQFGNNVVRNYEGRFGIVGGVTPVIDAATFGNTVLGERFIKYRMRYRGGVSKAKDAILRALSNMYKETEMRHELRETAKAVLNRPVTKENEPTIPQWFMLRALELGQLVGTLRGMVGRERYTQQVMHKPVSEFGTRLAKQFATLAGGVCVYRGLDTVDEDIYQVIGRVAMDTVPDRVEEIVKQLFIHGGKGKVGDVSEWTHFPQDTCRYVLEDMGLLDITHRVSDNRNSWALDGSVERMMKRLKLYQMEQAWRKAGVEE